MIRTILVPTDFSSNANHALSFALEIAKRASAKVILHHTCDDSSPGSPKHNNFYKETDIKKRLQVIIDRVKKEQDISNVNLVLHTTLGTLTRNINKLVKRATIDLIVMGTQGASGFQKVLVGTETVAVITHVNCPTIVVPELVSISPLKKIAVASDKEYVDDQEVLYFVKELAELFKAEIDLVKVRIGNAPIANKKTLEHAREKFIPGEKEDFTFQEIEGLSVISGIESYVQTQEDIDLIVLLKRKHNILQRFFNNSNTEELAFHTKMPMLVLHDSIE